MPQRGKEGAEIVQTAHLGFNTNVPLTVSTAEGMLSGYCVEFAFHSKYQS